jgi:hypothetical protein
MPVTAVLSKKFYEKFGEDMTNELVTWFNTVDATYRADINRLNDLNFQRFEATLKQALAELKTDMLKWMFGFWATTTLALAALIFRRP